LSADKEETWWERASVRRNFVSETQNMVVRRECKSVRQMGESGVSNLFSYNHRKSSSKQSLTQCLDTSNKKHCLDHLSFFHLHLSLKIKIKLHKQINKNKKEGKSLYVSTTHQRNNYCWNSDNNAKHDNIMLKSKKKSFSCKCNKTE
jgi:hypothetical protein